MFSLVELLVVIAIISALAAMLMPALSNAVDAATTTQCSSQIHMVYMAYSNYAEAYNGEVPNQGTGYATGVINIGQSTFVENPSKCGDHHPAVFVCPVSRSTSCWKSKLRSDGTYSLPTYFPNPGMWAYTRKLSLPTAGSATRRISPSKAAMLGEISVEAASTGAFYLFAWTPQRFGFYHKKEDAFNSLFFDGHVELFSYLRFTTTRDWLGY